MIERLVTVEHPAFIIPGNRRRVRSLLRDGEREGVTFAEDVARFMSARPLHEIRSDFRGVGFRAEFREEGAWG